MKMLEDLMDESVKLLDEIWTYIKENDLENNQKVLDWLDTKNQKSIRN